MSEYQQGRESDMDAARSFSLGGRGEASRGADFSEDLPPGFGEPAAGSPANPAVQADEPVEDPADVFMGTRDWRADVDEAPLESDEPPAPPDRMEAADPVLDVSRTEKPAGKPRLLDRKPVKAALFIVALAGLAGWNKRDQLGEYLQLFTGSQGPAAPMVSYPSASRVLPPPVVAEAPAFPVDPMPAVEPPPMEFESVVRTASTPSVDPPAAAVVGGAPDPVPASPVADPADPAGREVRVTAGNESPTASAGAPLGKEVEALRSEIQTLREELAALKEKGAKTSPATEQKPVEKAAGKSASSVAPPGKKEAAKTVPRKAAVTQPAPPKFEVLGTYLSAQGHWVAQVLSGASVYDLRAGDVLLGLRVNQVDAGGATINGRRYP